MGDTRPRLPDAKTLAALEPGMLHWEAIEPVWDKVDIYSGGKKFLATFKAVHKPQGLLLAAQWCHNEVGNGGFHQFFLNSTGVLAPEAILGFKLLEMRRAAALTMKAALVFGPEYPRDQHERDPRLERLTNAVPADAPWDPFEDITEAFLALPEIKRFDEHADAFVRRNMSMFFR